MGVEVTRLNASIAKKVGTWLLENNHTKRWLASSLGICVSTLNNKLRGKNTWSWDEVVRLSEILGCSLEDLR